MSALLCFDRPEVFWLLPLPLIFFYLIRPATISVTAVHAPALLRLAVRSGIQTPECKKHLFSVWHFAGLVCWVLLLCAVAGPCRVVTGTTTNIHPGAQMMLVQDISESMDSGVSTASGATVTRLQAGTRFIQALLRQRPRDTAGLIAFGSGAYLSAPLTRDHRFVSRSAAELNTGMAGGTTATGNALMFAVQMMKKNMRKRMNNVVQPAVQTIVLVTDGDNNSGLFSARSAARAAASAGIRICVAATGEPDERERRILEDVVRITRGLYLNLQDSNSLNILLSYLQQQSMRRQQGEDHPALRTAPPVRRELYRWLLWMALLPAGLFVYTRVREASC